MKKVGIIAHVDHGKTSLTALVLAALYPGPGLKEPVRSFEETGSVADVIKKEFGISEKN